MRSSPSARKVCSRCGKAKPLSEFYKQVGGAEGRRGACKVCFRAASGSPGPKNPRVQARRRWRDFRHPPLRDKLSGDELEVVRGYVAEEIRARLGAELLARASAGLLEPADELPNPFEEAMMAVIRRHMDEGVGEAVSEFAWTARQAMFAEA